MIVKGILHDTVFIITKGAVRGLLNIVINSNIGKKISAILVYQISAISVEGLMDHMENSIYDLIQNRPYYGSVWLRI
jgi:hypothetical protein